MKAKGNAALGGIFLGIAIGTATVARLAHEGAQPPVAATGQAEAAGDGQADAAQPAAAPPAVAAAPAEKAPDVSPRSLRLPALKEPRIVVMKQGHRVIVYDGQSVVKVYRAAIGEGRGDKTREGDKCTPEGQFYVCVKNADSKYVKALGLSYPNVEDAERGLRDGQITQTQARAIASAIERGARPPWNTALGGEIMIHGAGAGRDWTLGCIALDDPDIQELFPAIPLHTPVEIRP